MLWRPRTIHKRTAAAEGGHGAPLRRTAHPQGFQAILLASATHHEQSCSISRPQHAAHAVPHDDDGDPDPAWNTCRQGGRPEREQARAGHCCALLGSMMRHAPCATRHQPPGCHQNLEQLLIGDEARERRARVRVVRVRVRKCGRGRRRSALLRAARPLTAEYFAHGDS